MIADLKFGFLLGVCLNLRNKIKFVKITLLNVNYGFDLVSALTQEVLLVSLSTHGSSVYAKQRLVSACQLVEWMNGKMDVSGAF